jgi:diguanylate cyclase (GGDEF)-like protein
MTSAQTPPPGTPRRQRTRPTLRRLIWLGLFLLPIVAYNLPVQIVSRPAAPDQVPLLNSHTVLALAAMLAGIGALGIWRLATSVARATEGETSVEPSGALADRLDESAPLVNSFGRMLATIERQGNELNHFAQRLRSTQHELETTKARLQEVTFVDAVTKLYSRRFLSIRIEEEAGRYRRLGRPFSLVLLDIDGFAQVNDELGRSAGDETLHGVGQLLVKNSRAIDVVSRYANDEFAMLLVDTSRAEASVYVSRIRDLLSHCVFSHGRELTACFGSASFPVDGTSAEDLARGAEEALSAAKRAGASQVAACGSLAYARATVREVSLG